VPYLFTGQEYDPELGCYNYKARLYDPSMGRFHSPDPAGEWFSPYSYVGGNPISRIDPSGLLSRSGLRWALGGAYTAVYAAVGAAIGASVGAITGAALGIDAQETAGIGALSGAAAGASVGIARGGWEALVGSRRIRPASVAGERFPVVLYYEGQRTLGFESGRLGAELIAEQERIPQNLWKEHLIPYQIHLGQYPESFNGRVIAVAHGARSDGLVELGLTGQRGARDTAEEFARMFHARGQAPWPVNQIDMCICYAQSSGFASGVRGRLAATVRASPMTVTPVGPGRSMGVIRAVDAGADIRNFTIMRAAGAPMTDEPFRGIWEIEDQVS
jgi:RHS repeat-associated protein